MTPQAFRQWRKSLKLTQEQAAELLNVSRRTIIDWEGGATPIPMNIEHETLRRGEYGPVTLWWHKDPVVRGPGHRVTTLQAETFDTVDEAVDRGSELVGTKAAFTAHISDDKYDKVLWDRPSLLEEYIRRHPKRPRRTT